LKVRTYSLSFASIRCDLTEYFGLELGHFSFACSLFFSVRFVAVQLGPVQQRAGESVRRAAQVRVARARQAASVDGQAEARTAAPGGWLRLPPPLLDLMDS